ncbi:MAG: gamma-glutamyl-gamma-aminobutyrate hydrolase family protein, partial [Chitinophagaceae bacterium]
MKKRIGVSFTASSYENYLRWFTPDDLSSDLELVELSFQRQNYLDVYTCDGLLLTGGIDIHPSFYQGQEQYTNRPETFQDDRDRFEAYLYQYARS